MGLISGLDTLKEEDCRSCRRKVYLIRVLVQNDNFQTEDSRTIKMNVELKTPDSGRDGNIITKTTFVLFKILNVGTFSY